MKYLGIIIALGLLFVSSPEAFAKQRTCQEVCSSRGLTTGRQVHNCTQNCEDRRGGRRSN